MDKRNREEQVKIGTDNIFADLGLPDADERLAKAQLALAISAVVYESGLTQSEVATQAGLTQPQVSSIVRGRLAGFTLDRLFRVLNCLGQDVEIVISPSRARTKASVKVSTKAARSRKKADASARALTG